MFLEIHILQNFPPSNLNRDDSGAPKDCDFGGHRRQRISSQCLKRSVRQSDNFRRILGDRIGLRTKRAPEQVVKGLIERGYEHGQATDLVNEFFRVVYGINDKGMTDYLLYIGPEELKRAVDLLSERFSEAIPWVIKMIDNRLQLERLKKEKSLDKEAQKSLDEGSKYIQTLADSYLKGYPKHVRSIDVALFGRMLAAKPEQNIDAACQVAHAISVNRMVMEFDYFTAIDDLKLEDNSGAGMIGTVGFTSSCFYRFAVVDLKLLSKNLGNDKGAAQEGALAFLESFIHARPSGKQNTFAAHTPPAFVMVVVRQSGQPVSLANAFEYPAKPSNNCSLTEDAIQKLAKHYQQLNVMYGLDGEGAYVSLNGISTELNTTGLAQINKVPDLVKFVQQLLSIEPQNV
jgi:CRISPR system Cascade subunit CasC